jgi:hypothetical protein
MRRDRLHQVLALGKKSGKINLGLIGLWTGLSANTSYLLYIQVRQLCADGLLDDSESKCEVRNDEVVFIKNEGENK